MEKTELLTTILAFMLVGVLLYRKYAKGQQNKPGSASGRNNDSSFSSHSQDDDYEPYSKK
jgi:hypothetical protein